MTEFSITAPMGATITPQTHAPGTTNALISSMSFHHVFDLSGPDGEWSGEEITQLVEMVDVLTAEIHEALKPDEDKMTAHELLQQQIEDARNPLGALLRQIQELQALELKAEAAMTQVHDLDIFDEDLSGALSGLQDALGALKAQLQSLTQQLEHLMVETAKPREPGAA